MRSGLLTKAVTASSLLESVSINYSYYLLSGFQHCDFSSYFFFLNRITSVFWNFAVSLVGTCIYFGNQYNFVSDVIEILLQAESGDLMAYGLIPEFVGRFPILVSLSSLNERQLIQVLMEPKNALGKQFKKLFGMNNVSMNAHRQCLEPQSIVIS